MIDRIVVPDGFFLPEREELFSIIAGTLPFRLGVLFKADDVKPQAAKTHMLIIPFTVDELEVGVRMSRVLGPLSDVAGIPAIPNRSADFMFTDMMKRLNIGIVDFDQVIASATAARTEVQRDDSRADVKNVSSVSIDAMARKFKDSSSSWDAPTATDDLKLDKLDLEEMEADDTEL